MSKEIDWGFIHGDGEIVCVCDQCGEELRFPFEDNVYDFKEVQKELKNNYGWYSAKDNDGWHDFCSRQCAINFQQRG